MNQDNPELLDEWKKLATQIRKHNKLYEQGKPLIGDDYYDLMTSRLAWIEGIIGPQRNSPIREVRVTEGAKKIEHLAPMLSLDHGFLGESITNFLKKLRNLTNDPFPIIAEHKVDGIALALRYVDHKLSLALTRGNGNMGTDVLSRIKYLDVPQEIAHPGTVEIRGELFMRFADFEQIKDRFSSPRNACAAFLQNKEPISYMKVGFFPHNVIGLQAHTYLELINSLLGFKIFEREVCNSEQDCLDFFAKTQEKRDKIEYPIDGVVMKMNDIKECEKIGFHRTAPRYAFAAKFSPFFKKTTIREIEMQVGKFGTITPVAIFDPIEIDGSVIRRATLHNFDELQKHGYGPGDEILVSRAGDTIPYVCEKVYDAKNPISIQNCPSCGAKLGPFEKTLRCPGGWACPEQKADRLEHFCSLNAFNINGMGKKVVRSFIEQGFLQYPCDIFDLLNHRKQILEMDGWSEKSVTNLMSAIEKAKLTPLAKMIFGLCIPNVGYGNAVSLAEHFGSIENLILEFGSNELIKWSLDRQGLNTEIRNSAQNQQSLAIDASPTGIGKITLSSIRNFFNSDNQEWIKSLINKMK